MAIKLGDTYPSNLYRICSVLLTSIDVCNALQVYAKVSMHSAYVYTTTHPNRGISFNAKYCTASSNAFTGTVNER
jgi:hypothetical protein